jgi:hypothetical protein
MSNMKNSIKWGLIALIGIVLGSCSSMDATYKEFLEGSDKLYPGSVDSVNVFTGKERIKFSFKVSSDPKVSKLRIYWNSRQDSIETAILPEEIGTRKELSIPTVKEGSQVFQFVTFDKYNNRSVVKEVLGKVYGDNYQAKLSDRNMLTCTSSTANTVQISWETANAAYADVKAEIQYVDVAGVTQTVTAAMGQNTTTLPNYKPGNPLKYRTITKPDLTCMDEFSTAYRTQNVWSYFDVLKKSSWKVKAYSSTDATRVPGRCIDGNEADDATQSFWINLTTGTPNYPHWIVIDMAQNIDADAFYMVQRTVSYTAQLKDMEAFTNSTGDNTQPWVSLGTYTLNKNAGRQNVWLAQRNNLRYVKFVFYNDWAASKNLSLVELGALQRW